MNDEVKAKLVEYFGVLENAAKSGSEFVAEQLPLFVRELLAWEFYSSIFLVILFAILALMFAWMMSKCCKWANVANEKRSDGDLGPCVAGALITFGLMIVMLSTSATHGYYAVKVSVAPRVVLLEKVVELGNSVRK